MRTTPLKKDVMFSRQHLTLGITFEQSNLDCVLFDLAHHSFSIHTRKTFATQADLHNGYIFNLSKIAMLIQEFLTSCHKKPRSLMFVCQPPIIQEQCILANQLPDYENTHIKWVYHPLNNTKAYIFGIQRLQLLQYQLLCRQLRMHCSIIASENSCFLHVLAKRNTIIDPPLGVTDHLREIIDLELFEHAMIPSINAAEQKRDLRILGLYLMGKNNERCA